MLFTEIEDVEMRKLASAMLFSISLASAIVVIFTHWFATKFIGGRPAASSSSLASSGPAIDLDSIDGAFARQQMLIQQLESRIAQLEAAAAASNGSRAPQSPRVSTAYQALESTPSRLRYAN